jgi:predicted ATP-binding protein involved in virulence
MIKVQQEISSKEQWESRINSPAYFLSIELENLLCFKVRQKLDLSDANGFPVQWTVILGDNGVGKTTLLRTLAGMELLPPRELKHPTIEQNPLSNPRFLSTDTARKALQTPKILASFVYGSSLRLPAEQQYASLSLSVEIFDGGISFSETTAPGGGEDKLLGFRCYGYGANRRMGETSLAEALSSDRCASLFSDDEVLINAEEWLLQADYAVARSAPSNTTRFQERFNLVRDTLKQLLPDVSDIRITPADDKNPRPMAEFQTPYGWVPLKSLSLGYKTVIAWTVDLAARLIERYPHSTDPLAEPAVVLVDEIDLHLHPKWQRTIMSFLSERFPNTQFIVTAHSPLVVQAAKNANIVLLRREGDHVVIDNDPEIIDNWRVEQVLASVFDLPSPHSPDIEKLIESRRKILVKPKLTAKDERELKKLEKQIGTIPTAESPEDIRAMDIIRKAAKLLENS